MDDFFTVPEVAAELGVSVRRVTQMIQLEKVFPGARKINPAAAKSAYIIPKSEVYAEIKRRAQSSD